MSSCGCPDQPNNSPLCFGMPGFTGPAGPQGAPGSSAQSTIVLTASRTLRSSDLGNVLGYTGATQITLTVPTGLPAGTVHIVQMGVAAGRVLIAAGAGMTVRNRSNFVRTAGQYAVATLIILDSTTAVTGISDMST